MSELILCDEASLRTPEFTRGQPVVLADGQAWYTPRPSLLIRPEFKDGAIVRMEPIPGFGQPADMLIAAMKNEALDHKGKGFVQLRFEALAMVLLRNYRLTGEHLAALMSFDPDAPETAGRLRAINEALVFFPDDEGEQPDPTKTESATEE